MKIQFGLDACFVGSDIITGPTYSFTENDVFNQLLQCEHHLDSKSVGKPRNLSRGTPCGGLEEMDNANQSLLKAIAIRKLN